MIRQFVPQEFCLNCRGCCRFKEANSVWLPCLLEEEILDLIDKPGIPAVSISVEKKIVPVANPSGEGFFCPFLDGVENKCKIYAFRPFECQLYPFLINLRGKKVVLTLDLNCPYIEKSLKSPALKEYTEYLAAYLNSPARIKLLKDNPQVIQAYEEVIDLVELKNPDETK